MQFQTILLLSKSNIGWENALMAFRFCPTCTISNISVCHSLFSSFLSLSTDHDNRFVFRVMFLNMTLFLTWFIVSRLFFRQNQFIFCIKITWSSTFLNRILSVFHCYANDRITFTPDSKEEELYMFRQRIFWADENLQISLSSGWNISYLEKEKEKKTVWM